MGIFWLALTILGEIAAAFLRFFYGRWAASYLLQVYHRFPLRVHYPLTPTQVALGFVVGGFLLHVSLLPRQLTAARIERIKMQLRSPSKREKEIVERAYKQMASKASLHQALPFCHPARFRVYQGEGRRVHFIGRTLVIDAALFQLPASYLVAQLAHELWYYNGRDLHLLRILDWFPPETGVLLSVSGLCIGLGRCITWIGWRLYLRSRVYDADRYAARLGQKYALIQTLEELFLPLETPRDGLFYTEPYIESRIDCLHNYSY